MKSIISNSLLSLFTVLLCFLLGETLIRVVYHYAPNYDFEMWRYASDLKEPLPFTELPFHHYPNKAGKYYGTELRTNSLGLRDNEYAFHKPKGRTRIVILGDSFALGWGVPFTSTLSKQLERRLNKSTSVFEVINMGVGNYNSSMEVALFKRIGLSLQPNIVVLLYFVNDMEPTPRLSSLRYNLFSRFYLPGFIVEHIGRLFSVHDNELTRYYRDIYDPASPALAQNTRAIRELAGMCSERGIKLLIVNVPDLRQLQEYPFMFATGHIRKLALDSRVPFLDLLPVFARQKEESLWVNAEDPHMNALANTLAADALFTFMANDHYNIR